MKRRGRLWLLAAAALLPALAGGPAFYRRRPQELWFNHFLLPPVATLRVASLGEDYALADVLYASTTLASDFYRDHDLKVRIDTVSNAAAFNLDPDFDQAIYYGHYFAQFSAFRPGPRTPENDARRIALDNTSYLLLTGFHASADRAQFAETLSQEMLELKDYQASEHFSRLALAKQRGSVIALSLLGLMRLREGDENEALRIWEDLEKQTRARATPQQRYFNASARIHILTLRERAGIAAAQRAVDAFRERAGRPPRDWNELVRSRLIGRPPTDILGREYLLMAESGRVMIAPLTGEEIFD